MINYDCFFFLKIHGCLTISCQLDRQTKKGPILSEITSKAALCQRAKLPMRDAKSHLGGSSTPELEAASGRALFITLCMAAGGPCLLGLRYTPRRSEGSPSDSSRIHLKTRRLKGSFLGRFQGHEPPSFSQTVLPGTRDA